VAEVAAAEVAEVAAAVVAVVAVDRQGWCR
jgi:hypothetical protein